ncbi:Hybrid signal transduction histidine kinase J [Seminavis robusta]|uniref:Hybrid signal transduction histidine kinase J n=1 Tax=Seminavis robusta TaxID=568900 RepID=A0A9N8HVF8_9STRA|nr:Hybrid signal transduction histidine kinase J [Seminavis robusta]|eukprot:Sro1939_g306550.1 Hybrid signal transduction histidine kinase J (749) ;mRNA; f:4101-6347
MTTTISPSAIQSVAESANITRVFVELPRIELKDIGCRLPNLQQHEESLKDYVWSHCRDQLLDALHVEMVSAAATPNNCKPKASDSPSSSSSMASIYSAVTSIHSAVLANTVHNNIHSVVQTKNGASPLFRVWAPKKQQQQQQRQKCCGCQEKIQQLEQANARLTRTQQRQLRHFACASHELRTPLNCIIGLTSLLQTTEMNPLQAESMQLISSSSELLLTAVNDVLDYSKLESGHVDVSLKPANLQETLLGVVQAMELKHHNSSIKVRTHYSPQLSPTWTTDRLRMQQILFNLLGNAFKFSPSYSNVDLKVEIGTPGTPSVPSHVTQPITGPCVLRFVVKDYGCGIAPNALQTVFQPFVQAGEDTAKSYEGTGLGLAVTKKLVQALGGCVYANSTVTVGSEFVVEFPFDNADEFDVKALGERLTKTTCLVVPGPNLPPTPDLEQLLESYQVPYRILTSMADLDRIKLQQQSVSDLSTGSSSCASDDIIDIPADHTLACWIDEAVYQQDVMQRFQQEVKRAHSASLLWTVGPEYTVSESSNHFRNLLQIVPSVLMQSLVDAVEESVASHMPSLPGGAHHHHKSKQQRRHSTGTCTIANPPNGNKKTKCVHDESPPVVTATMDKKDVSILIVEDNGINQKVLRALLRKLGFTNVSVVDNGQKAVDAVAANHYHVVLMDVLMPVMNGLEATRIIVGRQSEKKPKIVFVTATVDRALEEEATRLGAFGFVPKPFNLKQLDACMTDICQSIQS